MKASTDKPTILDFYAEWCGPCKEMLPRLEAAVDGTNGKVKLFKVNIDRPELLPLLQQIKVQSVPTLIAVFGAKMLDAKIGAVPEQELKDWVAKVAGVATAGAPEPADTSDRPPEKLIEDAYAMMEDPAASVAAIAALLVAALEKSSGAVKSKALAGLASCSLRDTPPNIASARELAESANATTPGLSEVDSVMALIELTEAAQSEPRTLEELMAAVAVPPTVPEDLYALAIKQYLLCKYDHSVETGLRLVKQHRAWEGDRSKETVLKLLKALGPNHLWP